VQLIDAVKSLIVPYIAAADASGQEGPNRAAASDGRQGLFPAYRPEELVKRLNISLPEQEGHGKEGLLETIQTILVYSVNTWDQGFLDKLYSSTNAVRAEGVPGPTQFWDADRVVGRCGFGALARRPEHQRE